MGSSIDTLVTRDYQYGFVTDIEADQIPPGLSEETVRLISAKKGSRSGSSSGASRPSAAGRP